MSETFIYEFPEQPPVGTRLKDQKGIVYTHVRENAWHAIDGTAHGYNWAQLIAQHAPLTHAQQHAIGEKRHNNKEWLRSLPVRTIVREFFSPTDYYRLWRKTALDTWESIERDEASPETDAFTLPSEEIALGATCTIIWLPRDERDTTMLKVGAFCLTPQTLDSLPAGAVIEAFAEGCVYNTSTTAPADPIGNIFQKLNDEYWYATGETEKFSSEEICSKHVCTILRLS